MFTKPIHRFISIAFALLFALTTSVTALADPGHVNPSTYTIDPADLPFDAPLSGVATTRYWGILGGAGYRVEVPQNWNGELVLYAHGYRGNGPRLTVDNHPIREYLIQHGFAWAASSYSTNGYDVRQGVLDTHNLGEYFNGLVAKPKRTYFTGISMGGHITGVAIEQYPNAYAGAMPMCGVMGDTQLFNYFLDYNLVAEDLAGTQAVFPFPANYMTATVPQLETKLWSSFPFVPNTLGEELKQVTIRRTGGPRPLMDYAFGYWNYNGFLFSLNGGDGTLGGKTTGNVYSNIGTVYQIDNDPALNPIEQELNASVLRVAAAPQGVQPNGLANVPAISGKLPIPVLSMHTIGDLFVPFSMEQIYARRAAANGVADRLVTRAIRDVGHCQFNSVEMEQGFGDLINWVENGHKPAGDDILNPTSVANPNFGCTFTRNTVPGYNRDYAPACPA